MSNNRECRRSMAPLPSQDIDCTGMTNVPGNHSAMFGGEVRGGSG